MINISKRWVSLLLASLRLLCWIKYWISVPSTKERHESHSYRFYNLQIYIRWYTSLTHFGNYVFLFSFFWYPWLDMFPRSTRNNPLYLQFFRTRYQNQCAFTMLPVKIPRSKLPGQNPPYKVEGHITIPRSKFPQLA